MSKTCNSCNKVYYDRSTHCAFDGSLLVDTPDPLTDGQVDQIINSKYRIVELLSEDHTKSICLAEHLHMGIKVAITILKAVQTYETRQLNGLRADIRALLSLQNAHTTHVFDFGVTEAGSHYIVTDYVEGVSLADIRVQQRILPMSMLLSLLEVLCEVFEEAQEKQVINGALSPESIIYTNYQTKDEHIKIIFPIGPSSNGPQYISPEQAVGYAKDRATDIYCFGILLYEALTGELPFKAVSPLQMIIKHITEKPRPLNEVNKEVSPLISAVVLKALSKRPEDRYQSFRELQTALLNAVETEHEPGSTVSDSIFVSEEENMKVIEEIKIGNAFAFIDKDCLDHPQVTSMLQLLGISSNPNPTICSLLGEGEVDLFGRKLDRFQLLKKLNLSALTTDKMIYQHGRDQVTLVAAISGRAVDQVLIDLYCQNQLIDTLSARIVHGSRNGHLAIRKLYDLAPGEYKAVLSGTKCEALFTIAEYQLAPLTAEYIDQKYQNEKFTFSARLATFGVPLTGKVRVELTENGRVITSKVMRADANGQVNHSFSLKGEGPFVLNFIALDHAEKITCLPIIGSRAAERKNALVSELGRRVETSVLPLPEAISERGLHFKVTAYNNTPFLLEKEIASQAVIASKIATELVKIVVINPITNEVVEHQFTNVKVGEKFEISIPKPYGLVMMGTFVDGEPWEGWATVIHPTNLQFQVHTEAKVSPGSEIKIRLKTNQPDEVVPVFLLVKDRRLIFTDTLESGLAGSVKSHLEQHTRGLNMGKPTQRAHQVSYLMANTIGTTANIFLQVEGGVNSGQKIPLTDERRTYIIGRAPACDIVINDPEVALQHARLVFAQSEIQIQDLAGDQSLFVNGARVGEYATLYDGAVISFGQAFGQAFGQVKNAIKLRLRILSPNIALSATTVVPAIALQLPERINLTRAGAVTSTGASASFNRAIRSATASTSSATQSSPQSDARPTSRLNQTAVINSDGSVAVIARARITGVLAESPLTTDPSQVRNDFPEVVYAQVVSVQGEKQIAIQLGDAIAEYTVQAFALDGLDWRAVETEFITTKELFAELSVTPFVAPGDFVLGCATVRSHSGRLALKATIDEEEIPLWFDGVKIQANQEIKEHAAEIWFPLRPGMLKVTIQDLATKAIDTTEREIYAPGKFQYLARRIKLLSPGEKVSRQDDSIKALKVLPGISKPFRSLVLATANYGHCCCEQTAAKIVSGVHLFFIADGEGERDKAEAIIIAGIEREKKMYLPGRGFKPYPTSPNNVANWTGTAWKNLAKLEALRGIAPERVQLAKAVEEGLKMVHEIAQAQRISLIPTRLDSLESAYKLIKHNKSWIKQAVSYACEHIRGNGNQRYAQEGDDHLAQHRYATCYAAAILLYSDEKEHQRLALDLANWVLGQIDQNGCLYATYDSVACMVLLSELERQGLLKNEGAGKVKINNKSMDLLDSLTYGDKIEEIEAIDGVVTVEMLQVITEDWDSFHNQVPIHISFQHKGKSIDMNSLKVGDAVDLHVELEDGYQEGDFLQVCLPACLSRIVGGVQAKKFQIDFQGKEEVTIPLVAVAPTLSAKTDSGHLGKGENWLFTRLRSLFSINDRPIGAQHWSLAVRNMYREDRVASTGELSISVLA